ncbi:hypothetical protein ABPG72_003861 [Tetrahymena utriculariae]
MKQRDNYFIQHAAQRANNFPQQIQQMENVEEDYQYEQEEGGQSSQKIQNGYYDQHQQIDEQSHEDDAEWHDKENENGSNSDLPYEQKILNKRLNDAVQSIRQDKNIVQALNEISQLVLKAKEFLDDDKYNYMFETVIKVLNKDSVESLNENNWEKCSQILNVCDDLTQPHKYGFFVEMRALSLNNQGCMYKRMQDYEKALACFQKALYLQIQQESKLYLGYTHLNLSAILNQIGDHKQALSHAKKSVIQLHKEFQEYQKENKDIQLLKQMEGYIDVCNNLALAFYNVAVEEEFFNNVDMATLNYENALTFSEENLGLTHHMTNKFRETLNEFLLKLQQKEQEEELNRVGNDKPQMRPKGQVKKIVISSNKMNRPSSAPKKGQQALDQIAQIEKKISSIKDAYSLKGSDFEFKGNQVRIRSANRRPNQINNQNIKIVQKKGNSPNADRLNQQLIQSNLQNPIQPLYSQQSNPQQFFQKYLTDANGTRGAITASIRFHRTPEQSSNKIFRIAQRGVPVTGNHNSSRVYLDYSQNSIQNISQSHQNHPLVSNQRPSNSKLRPTSANPRGFKKHLHNDQQQDNISYTQGVNFDNSYINTSYQHNQSLTTGDYHQQSQKFPYQYPMLKRNNNQENNYDQAAMSGPRQNQNLAQNSYNQGQSSSFHNNSNGRININNAQNNSQYSQLNGTGISINQSTGYSTRGFNQSQQQKNTNKAYVKQQSPNKNKREVTFSEEDEPEQVQFNNQKYQQAAYNNYFNQSNQQESNQESNQNNNNHVQHNLNNNNYQMQADNQYAYRNQQLQYQQQQQQYPNQMKQQNKNKKHYDDFQPEDTNNGNGGAEEVYEAIQEEDENDINNHRSVSIAAVQQMQNNVVENYDLDWEEDVEENYEEGNAQADKQVKINQSDFLNNLKQNQIFLKCLCQLIKKRQISQKNLEDKIQIDKDLEHKRKEQEELQKKIDQLKEIEKQEQQRLEEQEKIKKLQFNEIQTKEQLLNQRIQELIRTENEEKQKYAKLKEQEEKARLDRLKELEQIAKQAEEQKQKLELIKQKEIETSSNLQRSMRIGSEEQLGSQISERPFSSSKRILIKKSSGLQLQNNSQIHQDSELSEESLNQQLKANQNYIVIKEFSERDINICESEKPNSSSSSRMTSNSSSTRRGLVAVVYEINLYMLIIIYVDNQVRLQQQSNQSFQIQVLSTLSLRRKHDQWQHTIDWSDFSSYLEQKQPEELQAIFLNAFESQIEQHLRVNLKDKFITLLNMKKINLFENSNTIIFKFQLKKNAKSSYVELDNSAQSLIELQNEILLKQTKQEDIVQQYEPINIFCSSGNEKSGIFGVFYDRVKQQLVFEFVTLLSEELFCRYSYRHCVDVSSLKDHYHGGDYLSHSEYTKVVKMIFEEYQKVSLLVRAIDEKEENQLFYPLKVPFSQKWSYLEILQDTPKHTIEAHFLLTQNSSVFNTSLVIEETLNEKQKTELTEEDIQNLIQNTNEQLLQKINQEDILIKYHQQQIVSIKGKNKDNKTKNGILGVFYLRESAMIIVEYIAVRNFDIEDTHTYQHILDLRLVSQHYNNGEYLSSEEMTKVINEILDQYHSVESQITIEPHYLKIPFNQDWQFEEITQNEETKVFTFFSFSIRAQGKTIVEKKQTIQNLLPQPKKNKKVQQIQYSEQEVEAAQKIQQHYKIQENYKQTKRDIQNRKRLILSKRINLESQPYFIQFFEEIPQNQYCCVVQSLNSRKSFNYIHFKQEIKEKLEAILQNPNLIFEYYVLDTKQKQLVFKDKKDDAAKKITKFFCLVKRQKSLQNKVKRADIPFKVLALRKINFEDKYYLFTIIEKKNNNKHKFTAKVETLNQKGVNRWKSEIVISSYFAKTITSQNKISKKKKKINPFNFFDIDFERRQMSVKHQVEKQISSQYISKNIKGRYQVQAKFIVKKPLNTNQDFLFSICKHTNKKSKGFSGLIETIKASKQIKMHLKLSSIEAKYLIQQIKKNSLNFEQEFNLDIEKNVFEVKKERKQIIAQSYIQGFIKSRLRFRKLFKELFIYQVKKCISTEVHGKRVKYMFVITKKLNQKITTAQVLVTVGKNINKKITIPNVFGKYFNLESRIMKDKWDPTRYFEIDPIYGFFEWKKGKKEEVAIKLIISCLRRRNFQKQIKKCQNLKFIHKITPNILLTIRSIDSIATPYIIRADLLNKSSSSKVKPGFLRLSQPEYDSLIKYGKNLQNQIKVDEKTLQISIQEENLTFEQESLSNNNINENISPIKKRQNSGLITQNEIQEDFASISRAFQSNQRNKDDGDLDLSPSIDRQSENGKDLEKQKIHLESAFDRSTPASNKNMKQQNNQKSKDEFNQVQDNNNENSKKHDHHSKESQQKMQFQDNQNDFNFDDLEYDQSYENTQKGSPMKTQRSDQKQQLSAQKEENYNLEELRGSFKQEKNKQEDNEFYEPATENYEKSQNKNNAHLSESKDQQIGVNNFENNKNNQKNTDSHDKIHKSEENHNIKERGIELDTSPNPKKLNQIQQSLKNVKQEEKNLQRFSLTEEDLFDQSQTNQYKSFHNEQKQSEQKKLQNLVLDTIEIYNISKKDQKTAYSTLILESQFNVETSKIQFSCPKSSQIKQVEYKVNLNKLNCLNDGQLNDINHEEVINEIQEYIYNNLMVYVVENKEIIVLSEEQLNLIKKIQKKFMLKHYRLKYQMNLSDEFLATSYSCQLQLGAIKKDIFIVVITQQLSLREKNNEQVKKFVKLSDVSVRKISRNKQKYLFDNVHFDQKNRFFYFDLSQFKKILEQDKIKEQQNNQKLEQHQQDQNHHSRTVAHSNIKHEDHQDSKDDKNKSIEQQHHNRSNSHAEPTKHRNSNSSVNHKQQDEQIQSKRSINSNENSLQYFDDDVEQNKKETIHHNLNEQFEQSIPPTHNHNHQNSIDNNFENQANNYSQCSFEDNQDIEQSQQVLLVKDLLVKSVGSNKIQFKISAYWQQEENKIIFKEDSKNFSIIPYNYDIDQELDLNSLEQLANNFISDCVIDKNRIIYMGKLSDAAIKLQSVIQKEIIVKEIDINVASAKKLGNAQFGRKGQKWFVKLFTYSEFKILDTLEADKNEGGQFKQEKILTDYLEIKKMSKINRQKIIKYFGLLINSNIEVIADQFKFIDKEEFLKSIQLQIYQSPKKEQVLA